MTTAATSMQAMVWPGPGRPLVLEHRAIPRPGPREVLLEVEACAVCRTDLHIVDGDLALPALPRVPGHEIVGVVREVGAGADAALLGRRVGVGWLGHTCGHCSYCTRSRENLCDTPTFTGYGRDGGFATHMLADAAYAFELDAGQPAHRLAPLMCAGLIGWRSLKSCGDDLRRLGIYGFGAAAHLIAQLAIRRGSEVFAFVRPGDAQARSFALELGARWAGGSDEPPPQPLDAAIIFAPVGALVPAALRAVRKGGRVVCGGIHMSDIPPLQYRWLWEERQLLSIANLTRADATEFLGLVRDAPLHVETRCYPLARANDALDDLRAGRLSGAAVLLPPGHAA